MIFITGSICGVLAVMVILISITESNNQKKRDEIHRLEMKEERNKQVYLFRLRMIYMFESKVLDHCGTYEDMLESDKALIAKEWVKVDELVNLN